MIGDVMADACEYWTAAAAELPDPLARLRYYITSTLERLDGAGRRRGDRAVHRLDALAVASAISPKELAEAEKPFVDLLRGEVNAAIDAGLLNPPDPEWDPWFVAALARSVFHFYAFAAHADGELDLVKERLWRFCLTALGGADQPESSPLCNL